MLVFSQEYPVDFAILHGSIPGSTLFQLCINDLPKDVIYDPMVLSSALNVTGFLISSSSLSGLLNESDLQETGLK